MFSVCWKRGTSSQRVRFLAKAFLVVFANSLAVSNLVRAKWPMELLTSNSFLQGNRASQSCRWPYFHAFKMEDVK